ncbi:MAG: sigma-70 family RNA polymerase sigma factor [Ruminococcaceae bacterium]|nr:sigma-70 family RNA polymerase sigma factor [Oscillospiraceae bacterium]
MDIEELYDKVYRYCYFRLHDGQLAQDITQETFLRFFKQEACLDNSRKLPYLYVIARNLCVDEYRRKKTESLALQEEDMSCDPSEEWTDRFMLKAAVSGLPDTERELLFLRYVNELPMASICKITGLSRFAVRRRLSRTLAILREELKNGGLSE